MRFAIATPLGMRDTNLASFGRDLEKAVEDLSELLESPLEPENIPTLRQQVTNKTVSYLLIVGDLMLIVRVH